MCAFFSKIVRISRKETRVSFADLNDKALRKWGKMQDLPRAAQFQTDNLTPREQEILVLIVFGNSNQQIADNLSLSIKTVEWHRYNMMKKLGIHKTANLVRYAMLNHLVDFNIKKQPINEIPS